MKALHLAATEGHVDTAEALLEFGAPLKLMYSTDERRVLHILIHTNAVAELIVVTEHVYCCRCTPFDYAVTNGH